MSRGTTLTLLAISAIGGAAAFAACSKSTPEPSAEPVPTTVISATAPPAVKPAASPAAVATGASTGATGATAGPNDLAYDAPSTWTSAPNTSSMRKATFKIPKVAGDSEDAELAVSMAGGGVEPNIKRWAGQFGGAEPKTEPRTVNGLKVTVVEIKGTYASGGMMGGPATPKEKQMLLAAIVEGADQQLHFFKLVGPEKTVTASKKDFDKFVSSFRAK